MASSNKTLDDLFRRTLGEVYHAEKMVLKVLPKMVKAARAEALRTVLERHVGETEQQVARLDGLYEALGQDADPQPCAAMRGLIDDAKDLIDGFKKSDVIDVGLTAAGRAIEHYEVTRYEALQAMAVTLGHAAAAAAFGTSLGEERALWTALGALPGEARPATPPIAAPNGKADPAAAKPAPRRARRPGLSGGATAAGPKAPRARRASPIAAEPPATTAAAKRARSSPRKPAPRATPS